MQDDNQGNTPAEELQHDKELMALENLWTTHRKTIFSIGIAVLVAIFIWGAITFAAQSALKDVQAQYLSLSDKASKVAFAKRNLMHPLGGLVMLDLAHGYYEQGDYKAALEAYSQARQGGLKQNEVLSQQALLGEAFSQVALDHKAGLAQLEEIAKNAELMDATRGHALYELAGLAVYEKRWDDAKAYVATLNTLTNANTWKSQSEKFAELYLEMSM